MNGKTLSLLKQTKYKGAPEKSISFNKQKDHEHILIRAEFVVDLVALGYVPTQTVEANVRHSLGLSDEFNALPFQVDDIEEGITVIREFCIANELPFTEDDEFGLRKKAGNSNKYLLLVFERPIYN